MARGGTIARMSEKNQLPAQGDKREERANSIELENAVQLNP
jgi:hypothetical protein